MFLTLLGMVASLLIDILVIKKYGVGLLADAYVLLNTIPVLLEGIIREGTRTAMVPIFSEYLAEKSGHDKISGIINLGILVSLVLVLPMWIGAQPILELISGEELTAEHAGLLLTCFRALLIIIPLAFAGSMIAAVLIIYGQNNVLAQRNIIPPLCVAVVLVVEKDISLVTITWGTVIGYLLYVMLLGLKVIKKGFCYRLLEWPTRGVIERLGSAISWTITAMVIGQGGRFFERMVLTKLGVGLLARYYMAFRVVAAIQTLIGHSFAVIGIGSLTREKSIKVIGEKVASGVVLAIIASIFVEVYAETIVEVLFSRGSLDAATVTDVSTILRILGFGMIFQCAIPILELPIYVGKSYRLIAANSAIIVTLKVVLTLILARIYMANGVALAVAAASAVGCFLPVIYIARQKKLFGHNNE